jgi:hypothetical protein
MSEQAEIQQAAATGAAAAVGAVADQQEIEQRAEQAEAAAATSADIAQIAAQASELASTSAQQAIAEAEASQSVAESAVQQAGIAQQTASDVQGDVSGLRQEFGQLTQAVRSLLDLQKEKGEQVQEVTVNATPPEPTTDQPPESEAGTSGGEGTTAGGSDVRRRHKFGKRIK